MQQLNNQYTPPAQLWSGDHEKLIRAVEEYLMRQLCAQNMCKTCAACRQIRTRQHHTIMWLQPENNYTLEDIRPIQTTMALALEPTQHYFFVLYKADRLTAACANSLLKSVEEPPRGYHFIFLTERPEYVLPTIRSRCTINTLYSEKKNTLDDHFLYTFFTTALTQSPTSFLKEVESSTPSEQETIELIDAILTYWVKEHNSTVIEGHEKRMSIAQKKVAIFTAALAKPPMPGSGKIFWKNVYLRNFADAK